MFKEFREFISRGNVVELAVGLIMATYFGAIVQSLVKDIIMPPIGQMISGVNFESLRIVFQESVVEGGEIVTPEVAIFYGRFINHIITFVLISLAIFLIVRIYNSMLRKKSKKETGEATPAPSKQEALLEEIRDLLKKQ